MLTHARQILMADDKELNQWASLKKAVRIRSAEQERRDRKRYRQRAKDAVSVLRFACVRNGTLFLSDLRKPGWIYGIC